MPAEIYGTPQASVADRRIAICGQVLLVALLFATLFVAVRSDPRARGSVADEPTYVLAALSLAHDRDLAFESADFERYVELYDAPPAELALASRDGGERISYGVPFLWSLLAVPFVLLWPLEGPMVLNALLLAVAALLAGRSLAARVGGAAWLLVCVFCFASVSFAYVFFALPDLALFATTACGLALVFGRDDELPATSWNAQEGPRSSWARWIAAGALLAVAPVYRPVYGAVLIAAGFVTPPTERRRAIAGMAAGAVLLAVVAASGQWLGGGSWTVFAGDRRSFAAATTGYPGVDFAAEEWRGLVRGPKGEGSVGRPIGVEQVAPGIAAGSPGPEVWGWNVAYFLAGRNVGLLLYYLPVVLAIGLATRRRHRWALAVAVAVAVTAVFWLRPFNFFGGREAVANRFFLPLYPALWFLAGRGGGHPARRALAALGVAALAIPFLLPLWKAPDRHPVGADGRYRYVSETAFRRLPFETTQRAISGPVVAHRDLWVRVAAGEAGSRDGGESLYLRGRRPVELLIFSPEPIGRLIFEFDRRAPSRLEVLAGGELADTLLRNDGGVAFAVQLARPRAEHVTYRTSRPQRIYRLLLEVPAAPPFDLPFTLTTGGWQAPDLGDGPLTARPGAGEPGGVPAP